MTIIALHLVTWNGRKYLEELFESLAVQTRKPDIVRILDNGSTDGTVEFLRSHAKEFFPNAELFFEATNLGFAGGHNKLFQMMRDETYVLLANQDLKLMPQYLELLVREMEEQSNVGSASGLLYQMTDHSRVDSAGLRVHKTRKVEEITTSNEAQINRQKVFGVSGTLPLYRVTALRAVACGDEFFDRDFESYKEDVDIAFRLQSAGWDARCVPLAIAYHDRTISNEITRDTRTLRIRRNSYRNHLCMLVKNEYTENFLKDFFWIIGYEFGKFGYLLFHEPAVLLGLVDFFRLLPTMLGKRRLITSKRTRSAEEIGRWFL